VLADGSQAFVANQGMLGNPSVPGSISVINLTSNTVTATIPAGASANETDAIVHGHPTYISSVAGLPTGKVYVTAPDSTDVTIIRTDTDAVLTHLTLQGNGSWVRVTQNQ
jgi:DNA-binding beta-propeller fold protein YncE